MYATKRRQRNFKRIREPPSAKTGAASNPSKRHRERLNGELETVANLLPFDATIIDRLDKLSVLRLAVSFLQIKAHFQICTTTCAMQGVCVSHPYSGFPIPMGIVPTIVDPLSGTSMVDPMEAHFTPMALKALGGFIIILSENGEIYYVSENIESYLGFLQSDILHQPIYEMIHSEDREELRQSLTLRQQQAQNAVEPAKIDISDTDRVLVARFRCLLDNTCGFTRVEIRGKFMALHSTQPQSCGPMNLFENKTYALAAICTPFVPPIQIDQPVDDPILKTKHSLDLSYLCLDSRLKQMLELDDSTKSGGLSFYKFLHPDDGKYVAEAHVAVIQSSSSALMVYRMASVVTGTIYYFQSSLRLFFKNSKAESIGATHRQLSEVDGLSLLEKRDSMKSKYLSFDDSSLQSPQNVTSTATLQVSRATKEALLRTPETRSRHNTPRPETSIALNPSQLQVHANPVQVAQSSKATLQLPDQYLTPASTSNGRLTFPFSQDFSSFTTVFPGYMTPTAEIVDPRWVSTTKRPEYPIDPHYYPTLTNYDVSAFAYHDYGASTSNGAQWLASTSNGHFATAALPAESWDFAHPVYPTPYKKELTSTSFNHGSTLAYALAAAASTVPTSHHNEHVDHHVQPTDPSHKLNSTSTSGMNFISEVANTLLG